MACLHEACAMAVCTSVLSVLLCFSLLFCVCAFSIPQAIGTAAWLANRASMSLHAPHTGQAPTPRTHRRHALLSGSHPTRPCRAPQTCMHEQSTSGPQEWGSNGNGRHPDSTSLDALQAQPALPHTLTSLDEMQGLTLPRHIAVIMDGNARWAKKQGRPATAGHEAGARALWDMVRHCAELNIQALTVFAFSAENWSRPAVEVNFLMRLFQDSLNDHVDEVNDKGVRIVFIGDRQRLPQSLVARMESAEQQTCDNQGLFLTVAVAYSAQDDLTSAARRIAALAAQGLIQPDKVDSNLLASHLSTAPVNTQVGPPDLLIRTSGEQRLSNFLLFELAYCELYFTQVPWPAFDMQQLVLALRAFSSRQRRFGQRLGH